MRSVVAVIACPQPLSPGHRGAGTEFQVSPACKPRAAGSGRGWSRQARRGDPHHGELSPCCLNSQDSKTMKTERGAGLAFVCARHPGEMPVPKTWFLPALLTIHTSCPVWLAHNPSAPWPGWGWAGKPRQASQGSVTSPRTPRLKGKVSVLFKKCHAIFYIFFLFSFLFCFSQ